MSLMKLSPESVRLRRIAKACAAGEFSLEEYRQARREVISNFRVTAVDDDDTQPRQLRDDALLKPGAAGRPRSRLRRWWLGLALIAGALLTAAQVLAAQPFEIAPSAERDPNPATSPRFAVSEVRVRRLPALEAVSAASVDEVISAKLDELRARSAPRDHGFTDGELVELGRYLNALGVHEREALAPEDLQELASLIQEQKERRGLSVLDLEAVALAVQEHYRSAGYFLAVAYLPAQRVEDNLVELEVLPGVLGAVVAGEADERLLGRFDDLIGEPISARDVAARLYAFNQAPGRKAQVSFEPGAEVGETVLTLDVRDERTWRGRFAFDNYGDESTGEQRLVAEGGWLNPTGRGDALMLGLTTSVDGADQNFGYVSYETPLGPEYLIRSSLAYNDFSADADGDAVDADADGWLLDLSASRFLHRDRQRSLSFEVLGGYHELGWDGAVTAGYDDDTQRVLFGGLGVSADRIWDSLRIAAEATLSAELGRIDDLTFVGQDSTYRRLALDAFAWRPLDVPGLPGTQKLSLELRGQLASSQLPSSKRLLLGGHLAARGFQRDSFLVDKGGVARFDLRTPLAMGELSLFADLAYGDTQNTLDTSWGYLSSAGLGWNVRFRGIESRLSWALPISSNGSAGLDDDGAQLFWSFSYGR